VSDGQGLEPRAADEGLRARLVTRGGLGFALVFIPSLRFGWRGLAAALVAGALAAATVLVQRAAVARTRRGLSPTKAAAAASAASGLLSIAAIAQVAVILAARGAGPEAQVASVARLLGRLSPGEVAVRVVALLATGTVVGCALGAATLQDLRPTRPGELGPAARWLAGGVGLATGLLVATSGAVALSKEPFDPSLPLLLLLLAVFCPAAGAVLIVLPVSLLEGVLLELCSAITRER
jgi:hypothetical protein